MSRIVMVHGAGNDLWGPASIKSRWFPALADGLAWHGVVLDPSEVTVAFYGDLFREDPQRGYEPPVDAAAAIASIEDVVKGIDPDVDLADLTKLLTENHYDRLLAQAAAYLQHPDVRDAARARVEAAVGPDTQVLVAHSLGTLVTYETLCAHPEWSVTDLVTIGCPLGGDLIHAQLDPGPRDGLGSWPGAVLTWTNVADPDDPAARNALSGRFEGEIVEYAVDNGHRVHDPEPYLNNTWTGRAVAAGLTRR
jgi:pimeloyl-ACP methyl ester carboxylesterase